MKKVLCSRMHRMIEVVPGLLICECSDYGRMASLKGAVAEARALVEKAGGIAKLRDEIERAEADARAARKRSKEKPAEKPARAYR